MPLIYLGVLLKGSRPVDGGQNQTWRGPVRTSNGDTEIAYVKLMRSKRHLTVEALCAVLGREVGLPIPQPYIVRIPARALEGQHTEVKGFALGDVGYPPVSARIHASEEIRNLLQKWEYIVPCAAFDGWIGNSDRLPYNLLYDGGHQFSVIDHDEALQPHLSDITAPKNTLVDLLCEGASEHQLHQTLKLLLNAAKKFNNVDWELVRRELIFSNSTDIEDGVLDPLISLLTARIQNLRAIYRDQLGIKQLELNDTGENTKSENWGAGIPRPSKL